MSHEFSPSATKVLAIGDYLLAHSKTISCAESCTGGGVAFALTQVSGSSGWFNQSWVTYSNEAKAACLGVDRMLIERHGAVSQATVEAMAQGVILHSGADVAVAVSGIAGPTGGSEEKPVGTVWFGFVINGEVMATKQWFDGDRDAVRLQAVWFAIDYVHRVLCDNE